MARARSPDRDKAKELYLKSGGKKPLIEIASELNIKDTQVRKWKSLDKWEDELKGTLPITKGNVTNQNKGTDTKKKEVIAEEVEQVINNPDLTDKQRLFCLHYVKCFNATKAYQKAYGCSYETAMVEGSNHLRNPKIKEEIYRLKQNRLNKEMFDEMDLFQRYMDIACADITDFVEFGQEDVPIMTMHGPAVVDDPDTGEKVQLTKRVNTVRFKEHTEVDGTLISEVKMGRDGASIKLSDRMKAMDWLDKHMGLATEEQKARLELLKAQAMKIKSDSGDGDGDGKVVIINDV